MSSPHMGAVDHAEEGTRDTLPIENALAFTYGGVGELDRMLRDMRVEVQARLLQGCLPLLLQEIAAETLGERIGREQYERMRACYREMCLLNLWYSAELKQVLGAIAEARIPVLALKGADLASTLYPHPDLRYFDDVDLMVHPRDLAATIELLEKSGYVYFQEYRFESISTQRAAFVYVKTVAVGYLMIELHTAPHSNELGISFDVASIWQRARQITVFDSQVLGMGLEDLFLYLCWHCRSHYFERLIWLYDVALALHHWGGRLDWSQLYRLASQQGLKATVYYMVRWCQLLWGVSVPEAQLETFAPPTFMRWLIARFIGQDTLAVLRRSSRRARKLMQHLMVDDLKTLCLVELRTLFPSPTHLGRLYMEHSRLPLRLYWVYYGLHPFFALRESLRIVLRAGRPVVRGFPHRHTRKT